MVLIMTSCVSAPAVTPPESTTGLDSHTDAAPIAPRTKLEAAPQDAEIPIEIGSDEPMVLASNAVAAYCSPRLSQGLWLTGLMPFLSEQAATAYGTVDPARVRCSAISGDAWVRDGDVFTVRVVVPTDVGEYEVYVHRESVDAPYVVERLAPPAS